MEEFVNDATRVGAVHLYVKAVYSLVLANERGVDHLGLSSRLDDMVQELVYSELSSFESCSTAHSAIGILLNPASQRSPDVDFDGIPQNRNP